jgi:hypothetical protein
MKIPTFDEMIIGKTMIVKVKIPDKYVLRYAFARFLIRLAARVLGCRIKLELLDQSGG